MVGRTSFINGDFSLINDEWLKWIYCETKLWLNGFLAKHTFNLNGLSYCLNGGWTDLFGIANKPYIYIYILLYNSIYRICLAIFKTVVGRTSFINGGFSVINDGRLKWIYCEAKLWLNGFSAKNTFNLNELTNCSNGGWTDFFGIAKQAPYWLLNVTVFHH